MSELSKCCWLSVRAGPVEGFLQRRVSVSGIWALRFLSFWFKIPAVWDSGFQTSCCLWVQGIQR